MPRNRAANRPCDRELVVINKLGIHARPAALFVKVANRFTCNILVEKDGEKINGKSIMGLMMLAAGPGSQTADQLRRRGLPGRASTKSRRLSNANSTRIDSSLIPCLAISMSNMWRIWRASP